VSKREELKIDEVYRNGGDSIALYMRTAREVPLLTRAQEIELSARVKAGDEEARKHMIRANLLLVVYYARKYEDFGVPLPDLIQAGNIGLMRAVDKYDPGRSNFSTYARIWIKEAITDILSNQSRTVRVPVYIRQLNSSVKKAVSRFMAKYGREPTDEETAGLIGIDEDKLRAVQETLAVKYCSLDAPLGHDTDNTVGSIIEDSNALIPGSDGPDDFHRNVMEYLDKLDKRERYILTKRFGLDGKGETTLEVIGAKFGVTRERIRQIQDRALRKLRKWMEQRHEIENDPTHPFHE